MNFFVGETVFNTMREREGRIVGFINNAVALVDYGDLRGERTSVKYLQLRSSRTDVQNMLATDPSALELFYEHFKKGGRIEISANEAGHYEVAERLSEISPLTPSEAWDYVRRVSENSHGAKFDILVSLPLPEGLYERLGVYIDLAGQRARTDEAQINSRPLAEWMIEKHGVLPRSYVTQ